MDMWDSWKKGFFAWENATAEYMEQVLSNPAVLGGSGQLLSGAMRARAQGEQALAKFWGGWGLPTKRDQERSLHALNQLQSTLIDLQERIADLEGKLEAKETAVAAAPAAPAVEAAPTEKAPARRAAKKSPAKKSAAKTSPAKKSPPKKS